MKKSYFAMLLVSLVMVSLFTVIGCGSSGGGGGGSGSSFVADVYVSTTGSDDAGDGSLAHPYQTIQKGLDMATSHEVVGVLAGVYTEEVTWPSSTDVTLRGVSKTTVIMYGDTDSFAIIYLPSGLSALQTITIESMTLTNNTGSSLGGGIDQRINNAILHLKDLIIKNNSADNGGGIYTDISNGRLVVENCTLTNNYATNNGGAIHTYNPTIILNCLIKDNTAEVFGGGVSFGPDANSYITNTSFEGNAVNGGGSQGGGAVYNGQAVLTIEGCSFIENRSLSGIGGAIELFPSTDSVQTLIKRCIIKDNWAKGSGGGVHVVGNVRIERCLISGNTTEALGGGVLFPSTGSGEVVNSIFTGNKAGDGGGGLYYMYSSGNGNWLHIYNCTFVTNEALNNGSAIYMSNGDEAEMINCIFWNNDNSFAREIDVSNGSPDLENSDYQLGSIGGAGIVSTSECTNSVPIFVNYPNDLHLSNSCTIEITEGGNDDAKFLTLDYDGAQRVSPNSMGAYK